MKKKKRISFFLENMDNFGKEVEKRERNHELGKVIASLQQPMKDVLGSIVTHQVDSVNKLLEYLKNKGNV